MIRANLLCPKALLCSFTLGLSLPSPGSPPPPPGSPAATQRPFNFLTAPFVHVTFEGLKATTYTSTANELRSEVDQSASFRLYPLAELTPVAAVEFAWRFVGRLHVKGREHEEDVSGDDAKLRVGLLLHGPAPLLPFFAPAWVRLLAKHMLLPADRMSYLIAGPRHAEGERWPSPHSRSITHIGVHGKEADDGWQQVHYQFGEPLTVVGLFVGADGDDTGSRFHSSLRELLLIRPPAG